MDSRGSESHSAPCFQCSAIQEGMASNQEVERASLTSGMSILQNFLRWVVCFRSLVATKNYLGRRCADYSKNLFALNIRGYQLKQAGEGHLIWWASRPPALAGRYVVTCTQITRQAAASCVSLDCTVQIHDLRLSFSLSSPGLNKTENCWIDGAHLLAEL